MVTSSDKKRFSFQSKGLKRKLANFLGGKLKRYRPKVEIMLNPLTLLQDACSALVVLPLDNAYFDPACTALAQFHSKFPHLRMSLACHYNFVSSTIDFHVDRVVILRAENTNFIKLPKKSLIKEIRAGEYDAALDLNPDGTMFSNILCSVSGARVRIGFSGEWSDLFLNYSFTPRIKGSLADNYKALMDYLS